MNIKRVKAPKEVKIALSILDELGLEFEDSEAFEIVSNKIEKDFLKESKVILSQIKKGFTFYFTG